MEFSLIPDTVRFVAPTSTQLVKQTFGEKYASAGSIMVERVDGKLSIGWEKWRVEHTHSWWGKMRIQPYRYLDHEGRTTERHGISIEYSWHKWVNVTNGENIDVSKIDNWQEVLLAPAKEALLAAGWKASQVSTSLHFAELKRLDLSINFRLNGAPVADFMKLMTRLKINYQGDCQPYKSESVYWGTPNSDYLIKLYDKFAEQKHYFGKDKRDRNKLNYWKENQELFKNIIRFEVSYKSKWMRKQDKTGQHMGQERNNKIIELAKHNTKKVWERIQSQFEYDSLGMDERFSIANVTEAIEESDLTITAKAQLYTMVHKALGKGADHVRNSMNQRAFYRYKKILKEKFSWDINQKSALIKPIELTNYKDSKKMRIIYNMHIAGNYNLSTDLAHLSIAPIKKAS